MKEIMCSGLINKETMWLLAVLRLRIRDPEPFGSLDPGSGMDKKSGSGSRMPQIICPRAKKQFYGLKCLHFFMRIRDRKESDPGSEMGKIRIRDPRWKKFGSGNEMENTITLVVR
jgi:hypothetical protein